MCPPFDDGPNNGDIDCSLGPDEQPNPGDTCMYTCDDGYRLQEGSTTRTCQNNETWSGMVPKCIPGISLHYCVIYDQQLLAFAISC